MTKAARPIDRYLRNMRAYAAATDRLAVEEARLFLQTGQHQRPVSFFQVLEDDNRVTARRLLAYQGYLQSAKRAGRYDGGTRLRRVLSDGTTEPWAPRWQSHRPTGAPRRL